MLGASALVLGFTLAAVGVNASSDPAPSQDLSASSEYRAAVEQMTRDSRQARDERRERRATPEARAERERSRTRYGAQNAEEALETARRKHEDVIEAPPYRGLRLREGERVEAFHGDRTAHVERDGTPGGAIVESLLPMRTRQPDGDEVLVDLRLDDRGTWFEPADPLVDVRLPKRVSGMARIEGSGVAFRPRVAEDAAAKVVADKAFYAEVARDTDYLLRPVPTGIESLFQLRSHDSPQELLIDLELPPGSRLQRGEARSGTIEVVQGEAGREERLGAFMPPAAWDADHEPVGMDWELAGSAIRLKVEHRGRDVAYPVIVDPTWNEDQRYWHTILEPNYQIKDRSGWRYGEVDSNGGFTNDEPAGADPGLYVWAGPSAIPGQWAHWNFQAPAEAWIFRYETYMSHATADNGTTVLVGVYGGDGARNEPPTYGWNPVHMYDKNSTHYGPANVWSAYWAWSNVYLTECTGDNPCWPYNKNGSQAAFKRNIAIFQLQKDFGANYHYAWLGGAQVAMQDDTPPAVSASSGAPGGWFDAPTASATGSASDNGFGVKNFELARITPGNGATLGTLPTQSQCSGTQRPVHCPVSDSEAFTFSTSEGINSYGIGARDFVDNWSGFAGWQLKVDRTPPTIDTSGSLADASETTLPEGPHSLRVDVTDGVGAGVSARAGVQSVEVKVDGVTRKTVTTAGCAAADNCKPAPFTFDFDAAGYAEGEHEVTVVAKDRLWAAGSPTASNHIRTTSPVRFKVRRAAGAEVGPGSVNLRTGVFTHSDADVNVNGHTTNLTFSRSYTSYRPADRKNGILGPGWTASLPVEDAGSDFAGLAEEPDGRVVVTGGDGNDFVFTKSGTSYVSPPGYPELKLRAGTASFVLADSDGNETTFGARVPDPVTPNRYLYAPTSILQTAGPGVGSTTVVYAVVNGVNRPTRLIAPAPGGVSCTATSLPVGCRALDFVYAGSTTATGLSSGQWGDYKDRLSEIRLTAFDPQAGQTLINTVAQYSYDALGLLRATWDPRISPALKTTYDYDGGADGNNRLTAVKAPGLSPWTLSYATVPGDPANTWRLKTASRATPQGMATTTVAYDVPLSGGDAPYQMTAGAVAGWGQAASAAPATATAIFPPDRVPSNPPSSYSSAEIHYLDAKGREVNTAAPGGRVSTSEYDDHGNVTRELSAEGRRRALAGEGSAVHLDTRRTFTADGLEMRDAIGPLHEVKLESGAVVKAREHTRISYDEGAPSSGYHLPTTTTVTAHLQDGTDHDPRVTKQTYDWAVRLPTSVTKDAVPGGLNLKTTTIYNVAGLPVETRQPAGPNGGTAHSTRTIYYTAQANLEDAACGYRPYWHKLVCKTRPVAQPGIPGKPDIPTTTYTYHRLNVLLTKTDKSGSSTRTMTKTYASGREVRESIQSDIGTPLPDVETVYDDTTGLAASTRTTEGGETRSVERAHDSLGRVVSYADADGNTSTTGYDLLGRPTTTNDGKGTQTRSYDATTGDLTRLEDSALGAMTASYDADGKLVTQTLPNGLTAQTTYDETGSPTRLRYEKTSNCTANCTWFDDQVTSSIHGQWVEERSTLSDRTYSYDKVGRLARVKDTPAGGQCTVRDYAYDSDSNRIRSERHSPNLDGSCNATTTGAITAHTYDSADRLIDPGYEYDDFGRITTVPAGDSPTSGATNRYYADDRVHTINTNPAAVVQRYDLDPLRRVRKETILGADAASRTNHFADDGDSPAWTAGETAVTWTRSIIGIDGGLIATHDGGGAVLIQLSNLHGDIVATAGQDTSLPALISTARYDEFGAPQPATLPAEYGWLGQHRRETSAPTGMVLMGRRVYAPELGRFLQVDPVEGGSANAYDYVAQDPVNVDDLSGTVMGCGLSRVRLYNQLYGPALTFRGRWRCPQSAWPGAVSVKFTFQIVRWRSVGWLRGHETVYRTTWNARGKWARYGPFLDRHIRCKKGERYRLTVWYAARFTSPVGGIGGHIRNADNKKSAWVTCQG